MTVLNRPYNHILLFICAVTSASSSEIENSDVTVLRYALSNDALSNYATNIEQILEAKNFKVATSLCAGRLITKNLISCARHSRIK